MGRQKIVTVLQLVPSAKPGLDLGPVFFVPAGSSSSSHLSDGLWGGSILDGFRY